MSSASSRSPSLRGRRPVSDGDNTRARTSATQAGRRSGTSRSLPNSPHEFRPRGFRPRGFRPRGFRPRGFRPRGFRPRGFRPRGFRPRGFRPRGFRPRGFRPRGFGPVVTDPGIDLVPEPLRRLHLNGCRQVEEFLEVLFSVAQPGASRTGLQMRQHFSRQLGSAGSQN